MKKRLLVVLMILVLLLSTGTVFASEITPYLAETRVAMVFEQTSNTAALAEVNCLNSEVSDSIKCKITLQEYKATSAAYEDTTKTKTSTVRDSSHLHMTATFSISDGKKYRIKVTVTSKKDGVTEIDNYFCKMTEL